MSQFRDLAPEIYRQRLVIEGFPGFVITDAHIKQYLTGLSDALDMKALIVPLTNRSLSYGWAGWIHWKASGAHFYAWDLPKKFFSVDIYTCKQFNPDDAIAFTTDFFKPTEIVSKSF